MRTTAGDMVGDAVPAGTWQATVARPDKKVTVQLHFACTGAVFLVAGATGAGRWRARAATFAYRILEPIIENGGYQGYVDIRQSGVVRGAQFESKGLSFVYDLSGVLQRVVEVQITGTRPAGEPQTEA